MFPSKLDEVKHRLEEMEVQMERHRENSEKQKNSVVIHGNVGSIGSVGGQNNENIQHRGPSPVEESRTERNYMASRMTKEENVQNQLQTFPRSFFYIEL